MSRRSRPGSTTRASGWPRCGSCPTTSSGSPRRSTRCASTHDYLFTTGGIGPTHDDITVDSIAAALGVPVIVHPEARRILEDYYRDRGLELTEARLRMARVPEGAELIPNPTFGRAGGQDRQHLHPRRRAAHRREHARSADRHARRRPAGGVGDGRRVSPPRARSPTCCARPRRAHDGRGDRQLSLLQGRPLRRQFRRPLGGRRRCAERCAERAARTACRRRVRSGRRRDLASRSTALTLSSLLRSM